jgi:hypothetical protein
LLTLGLAAAAVLAAGGGTLALLHPGVSDGRLSDGGRAVVAAVSRAMLDGTLPAGDRAASRAVQDLLARIDTTVGGLPPHVQTELSQLLALLGSAPGRLALAGLRPDWQAATGAQVREALQGMRLSGLALRQQAYQALHDLIGSAWFAAPATWSALGYPGPVEP